MDVIRRESVVQSSRASLVLMSSVNEVDLYVSLFKHRQDCMFASLVLELKMLWN